MFDWALDTDWEGLIRLQPGEETYRYVAFGLNEWTKDIRETGLPVRIRLFFIRKDGGEVILPIAQSVGDRLLNLIRQYIGATCRRDSTIHAGSMSRAGSSPSGVTRRNWPRAGPPRLSMKM